MVTGSTRRTLLGAAGAVGAAATGRSQTSTAMAQTGGKNIRARSRRLARRLVLASCGRQAHGEWAQGIHADNDRARGAVAPSRRQNRS